VFGEGETREEAIDSFWEMVDFIGGLARAPNWPHDRSPYVDAWETIDDEAAAGDKDPPTGTGDDLEDEDHFTVNDDDEEEDDLPPWSPDPWRPE
jgi:hypothetical protein